MHKVEQRIAALEQEKAQPPLVLYADDGAALTPEQRRAMDDARADGRRVIVVRFGTDRAERKQT